MTDIAFCPCPRQARPLGISVLSVLCFRAQPPARRPAQQVSARQEYLDPPCYNVFCPFIKAHQTSGVRSHPPPTRYLDRVHPAYSHTIPTYRRRLVGCFPGRQHAVGPPPSPSGPSPPRLPVPGHAVVVVAREQPTTLDRHPAEIAAARFLFSANLMTSKLGRRRVINLAGSGQPRFPYQPTFLRATGPIVRQTGCLRATQPRARP